MTARDLINGALRLLGVIASGEAATASELSDSLESLNAMLGSWSTNGFLLYQEHREEFDLVTGKQSYTMGPGADFDTTRPMLLRLAGIKQYANDLELPIKVFNEQEWARIPLKSTEAGLVQAVYMNNTYPDAELRVWPIPNVANKIVLYTQKAFTPITNATDEMNLPPGYDRAIKYNLALELAPEFGKTPSPVVVANAQESKAEIARANTKPVYMSSDAVDLNRRSAFNWLIGE